MQFSSSGSNCLQHHVHTPPNRNCPIVSFSGYIQENLLYLTVDALATLSVNRRFLFFWGVHGIVIDDCLRENLNLFPLSPHALTIGTEQTFWNIINREAVLNLQRQASDKSDTL